jgi:hypothetical protein
MNFFRKNLFGLAIASFLALGSVLTAEAFHHHDALESQTDCSFCVWQHSGSQASSTPASPSLLLALVALPLVLTFSLFHLSTFTPSFRGRAPPQNLL